MADAEVAAFHRGLRDFLAGLEALPQPVVAALNGAALGGGLELALACDLRLVADTARLGLTEVSVGIMPGAGGTQRLPRIVGLSRAKELIFAARRIDAAEALTIGLANRVVPQGTARTQAQVLAAEIARFLQECLRNDRASVFEQDGLTIDAALANEFRHGRTTLASGEAVSGAARFAQGAGRGGRFGE